jgi:apolipoprotein N-acyltransferase
MHHKHMTLISRFHACSVRTQYVLLFLSGALSTLSFAPFYALPVWLLTIPLCVISVKNAVTAKRAAFYGFWFGMGYYCAGLYWFAHALLVDAARFGWLIPFAIGGIGAVLALYHAVLHRMVYRARTLPYAALSCLFAVGWLGMEGLRSVLLTGFPWNLAGYSFAAHDVLLQSASLGGVWGASLLVILVGSMPCWFMERQRPYSAAGLMWLACGALVWFGHQRLALHPTTFVADVGLRLVQANIEQNLKWDPKERYNAVKEHLMLSEYRMTKEITHIIWPETAMTYAFEEGDFWAAELAKFAPEKGALITGVIRAIAPSEEGQPPHLFNSLKAVNAEGKIISSYDKRKLVPFGEYIPLRGVLPVEKITHGALDFSVGAQHDALNIHGLPPMRPLICYEAIFPYLSRAAHPAWILNITNDAWFGASTAPYQHFEMSRMRGVEQGVAVVRVANNGISAVMDAYGRVLHHLPLNARGVIDAQLPNAAHSPTVFARYGVLPVLGACVLLLLYVRHTLKRSL